MRAKILFAEDAHKHTKVRPKFARKNAYRIGGFKVDYFCATFS